MNNLKLNTVFDTILAPVIPLLKEEAQQIKDDAITYKLSFYFFTLNLLYGVIKTIKSIGLLVTNIKTSPEAQELGLVQASKSMYSEAFTRYSPAIFRRIFYRLLEQLNFLEIPEIKHLGRLLCIDGSIFPAFQSMAWAHYKKTHNALKLHLALELNRMLPVHFISTYANFSEKKALLKMLEAGVTYIADRGYVSFPLFYQITKNQAFYIIRTKANVKYTFQEILSVCIPPQWQPFLSQVTDSKIIFTNDKRQAIYRLVTFCAGGETYFIATNRFDLKTHEIILLYAYRWQIELLFRCLKRTFHALHLWSHDPRGIEVHFHIYLIAYLLLLNFKQACELQELAPSENPDSDEPGRETSSQSTGRGSTHSRLPLACGIVSILGARLRTYWKIGIHWLTTVQNVLIQPLTKHMVGLICARQ